MTALRGSQVQRPGDAQSLSATVRFLKRAIEMDLECALPCKVVSYDRAKNIAVVRPQIVVSKRNPNGGAIQRIPRVNIPDIPVLSLGAGNFHISFPVKPNDLGWIYACDRDITLFLQTLEEAPAATDGPSHRFTDAIFIPDMFRNYVINAEDAEAMVIQSTDSATRISLRADNIKITTPVKVTLDTPLTEITGNTTIAGTLAVVGQSTLGATSVNGKQVDGHDHSAQVPPF